ncbi:hypothetical protein [Streptomyces sparsogenes]|uniref:Uncharacterized protein n=1 Tax=Streptomyces sparsogenes DSM 40356 TaxID=1331668 RepID=A0A1R1SBW0_9ACTN|nr:hypothetical protein [Streptomyces sparsogenes]OMI35687.1 hypothetical protein SPAR_30086 [Streptomyces sparsogenes DSM 40356]
MSIGAKIATTFAGSVLALSAAVVPAVASPPASAASPAGTAAGPVQGAWLTVPPGTAAGVTADTPACC